MNKSQTFVIRSLGCKVSQYDGGKLRETLVQMGFKPADEDSPDLFILNSCAVTGRASQKCRQEMRAARKRWPEAKIVLSGCEGKFRDLYSLESVEADGVIPLFASPEFLKNLLESMGFEIETKVSECREKQKSHNRTRAFLKIQDGCSHFCTFCIVPHLRGNETSKTIGEVIKEASLLVSEGFREIVLTGIHLGRYEFGLAKLLDEMDNLSGLCRIRLSSIEPLEFDENVLGWLRKSGKACHHLHLPLQSGSDSILKSMNRPYDTADFEKIVFNVRRQIPDIAISTDLIVGFPGETGNDFVQTLNFIKKMGFSRIHIFRFSPRKGTPAASFEDQVAPEVKKTRSMEIEEVRKAMSRDFHLKFLNREVEVLWEEFDGKFWFGTSREYLTCRCPGTDKIVSGGFSMGKVVSCGDDYVDVFCSVG